MFSGVFAAAPTPRRPAGDEIDVAAGLDVIDFLAKRGVQGVALLGTTGEFIHFALEQRITFAKLGIKRSSVPILVNITHTTLDGTLRLAREADRAGAAGLLLMPPPFFPYRPAEIAHVFEQVARAVGDDPPLLLYSIPSVTSELPFDVARPLLTSGAFAGIKDSSGSPESLQRLLDLHGQHRFTLFVGNDTLFAEGRAAGANGVISGCASAIPELLLALDRALTAQNVAVRDRLQARLLEFCRQIDRFPNPIGVRQAAKLRGVPVGPHAIPLAPETQESLAAFDSWFQSWLPSVLPECDA